MAPENDEDEIVDLLGGNPSHDQVSSSQHSHTINQRSGDTHGAVSKMSGAAAPPTQKKPPMTGSTQKNKKSISTNQQKPFQTSDPNHNVQ